MADQAAFAAMFTRMGFNEASRGNIFAQGYTNILQLAELDETKIGQMFSVLGRQAPALNAALAPDAAAGLWHIYPIRSVARLKVVLFYLEERIRIGATVVPADVTEACMVLAMRHRTEHRTWLNAKEGVDASKQQR